MQIVSKTLPLSTRVQKGLKAVEESRLHKRETWGEGLTVLDEETVKLPLVKRKALANKKVFSEMPIDIKDYELLVGDIIQFSVMARMPFPEYATPEEIDAAVNKFTMAIFGHDEVYYPKYLKLGLSGIRKIAEDKLAEVKRNGTEPDKEAWYESVLISLDGLQNLHERYRDLASSLADSEADPKRKEELRKIAGVCQNLVKRPPQTFCEALQAYWFEYVVISCTGNPIAFGRFDQNLWPFLERDLENGTITLDDAQELIDLFWLKINERLQLLELVADPGTAGDIGNLISNNLQNSRFVGKRAVFLGGKTNQDRATIDESNYNQFYTNVALSGLTPEGQDGTNPLTYLALNATYRLKLVQPEMYLRLHKESPPKLYERAADLIRAGLANPNIFNDEAIIPALVKDGYPIEVAKDYTCDGCWEAHPQGRTYFKYSRISSIECLDRTLSPASWDELEVPGYVEELDPFRNIKVPDPYTYQSFDEVMETFKKVFDANIKGFVEGVVNIIDVMRGNGHIHHDINPQPLFSALAEGPLESGRDVTQGGMIYTQYSAVLAGLSHTADSLAVIK